MRLKFSPTITEKFELLILVLISTKKAIESEWMTRKTPKIYVWQFVLMEELRKNQDPARHLTGLSADA